MKISLNNYNKIIFFTGAGMSAESGVPTYRGRGGIWNEYKWEEYACQNAFNKNPEFVLDFHQLRRVEALKCNPHLGHAIISNIENLKKNTYIITQNIDGMHQRANSKNVIELHGSLWRLRCEKEGIVIEDKMAGKFSKTICECGEWLRPDIIWFEDMLKEEIIAQVNQKIIASFHCHFLDNGFLRVSIDFYYLYNLLILYTLKHHVRHINLDINNTPREMQ